MWHSSYAGDLDSFAQRRQAIVDAVAADSQTGGERFAPSWGDCFPIADALFAAGRIDEARKVAHRGLESLEPGNRINPRWHFNGNSGFAAWPGMDCYIRNLQFLDDALREHYRRVYGGAVFYKRMTTSNHVLMAAVARYLATQVWGADSFHADPAYRDASGSVFAPDDPTGEKCVRQRIAAMLRDAPGEYASQPYGSQNILPILSIADCASDPGLRASARAAFERSLSQLAPAWLGGHLATYSLRSYPDMLTQEPWGLSKTLWLYFGGVKPKGMGLGYGLIAAVSAYRLPPKVVRAATDRTQPYAYRSLVSQWALYHFVNCTYALFSRSPKPGRPWMNSQVYPCGVMWDEPDLSRTSQFWITNPAADESDDPQYRPAGIHTHGVSRYEREVQYRDAMLAVFDIEPAYRFGYVLGYAPGGFRAAVNEAQKSGRLFFHYGSVLIAVTASQPFEWNMEAGIRAPAAKPHAGDSEFRVMGKQIATAIETASPDEFPGATPRDQLEGFRSAVVSKSRLFLAAGLPKARYTDRRGNNIECDFHGDDHVNGELVDYKHWPLMEHHWAGP